MASDDSITTTKFTLNNGTCMPAVGLSTYRIREKDAIMRVVDDALAAGYRLFDTASVYNNEICLKNAFNTLLPKHGLEREDIFITTKLSPSDLGNRDAVEKAYKHSIDNLGLDYVDLYLIQFSGTHKSAHDKKSIELRNATWAALLELYDDGCVNAIGVCNFTVRHLKELLKSNHGVIPAVNQVEWHPFYHDTELLDYCKGNDIVLQGYSPFGGASLFNKSLLTHPEVTKTAKKLDITNAQLLLCWSLQQDVAVIPKSSNPEHIKQNIHLNFKIPNEDMRTLSVLSEHKTKFVWDSASVA